LLFFSSKGVLFVLVRPCSNVPLKKLPAIVRVRSKSESTVENLQLADFTGLTVPVTWWNPKCSELNRVSQMRMRESMEDAPVDSTFDIFNATVDGPLWVETVQGLTEAKERMAHLALTIPGEYFIHSQEKGIVARQVEEWADFV
jgi:hypothetical protein